MQLQTTIKLRNLQTYKPRTATNMSTTIRLPPSVRMLNQEKFLDPNYRILSLMDADTYLADIGFNCTTDRSAYYENSFIVYGANNTPIKKPVVIQEEPCQTLLTCVVDSNNVKHYSITVESHNCNVVGCDCGMYYCQIPSTRKDNRRNFYKTEKIQVGSDLNDAVFQYLDFAERHAVDYYSDDETEGTDDDDITTVKPE